MNFRNDIQGLRAIAVLLVFIFHLSSNLMSGGFVGVDMFFVISGFLVTSIVYSKIQKGTFSILEFYKNRVKRIVPAYLVMLLIVAIVASILFVNTDSFTFRKSLLWTLLFSSNTYFASLDNYFGNSSNENPLLHTWTLAVEMQFYLILPIVLLLIKNRAYLVRFLLLLVILLISYSTYGIYNGKSSDMYFSLLSRMPEFIIGGIAAIMKLENISFIKAKSNILSVIGLILIIFSAIVFSESSPFPGILSLIPCLGTLAILVSVSSKVNGILSSKPLVFIGEISYSIYLWHWPIMAFLRYYKNSYEFTFIESVWVISLTSILSVLSYYFVERQLRQKDGLRFYIPFGVASLGVVMMVLITPRLNSVFNKLPIEFTAPSFGLKSHGPSFVKVEEFGDTNSKSQGILFLGDSHALCMKKYIDVIGKRNGFTFKTVTNNTYPTIPGITKEVVGNERLFNQYEKLMKYVIKEIPKSKLIILQFSDNGDRWINAFKTLLATMNSDQHLILLSDFPKIDKNPIRVNRDIVKTNIKNSYVIIKKEISKKIINIIESDKRTRYLDLTGSNIFKDAPFQNDTLMYYDQAHLNEYGAKVYALNTEEKFMKLLKWGLINERSN